MNFDELQSAWSSQVASSVPPTEALAAQKKLLSEFRQRRRMLGYATFCAIFGLLGIAFFSWLSIRHNPATAPGRWVSLIVNETIYSLLLVHLFGRIQRHRELVKQSARSVRDALTAGVENLAAEIRDFRLGVRLLPLFIALAVFSVYLNLPVDRVGWTPLLGRTASILAFAGIISGVYWRHYLVNLKPEYARRKALLDELGAN
jgi:hypothetical protein